MPGLPLMPCLLVLQVTGKLELPPDIAHATKRKVVFQRCPPDLATYIDNQGTPMMIRAWIDTPPTGASRQTSQRARMREAVAQWHSAAVSERATAADYAAKRRLSLYNAYIALYLRSHEPDAYTTWDTGQTLWDHAKTLWERLEIAAWDGGNTTWDYATTWWNTFIVTRWEAGKTTWDTGATLWDYRNSTA